MNDVVAQARARVDRVKAWAESGRADVLAMWRERDWETLGYATWDAMCEAEFAGLRMALPRDERREVVADLRAEGMSIPAIGAALGASVGTVHSDLSELKGRGEDPTPERVMSLDGRERPASRPVVAERVDVPALPVDRYPELAHYADRPAKAHAIATALDGYDADERAVRREALAATIAAEQRNGGPVNYLKRDPDMDKADRLYDAVSAAARAAHTSGGPDLMARLVDRLDDITRQAWAGTYADLADRARAMADALNRPNLRSVK